MHSVRLKLIAATLVTLIMIFIPLWIIKGDGSVTEGKIDLSSSISMPLHACHATTIVDHRQPWERIHVLAPGFRQPILAVLIHHCASAIQPR